MEELRGGVDRLKIIGEWARERRVILKGCGAGHFRRNAFVYAHVGVAILHILGLRYAIQIDETFAEEGALWFQSLRDHDAYLRLSLAAATCSIIALGAPPRMGLAPKIGYGVAMFGSIIMVPIAHFVA
jgi:hypothetical protein